MVEEVLDTIDLLLIMTVEPGFGGQELIPSTVGKVSRARRLLDAAGSTAELEVDGGINPATVAGPIEAGARVLVAGSAVFGGNEIEANMQRLQDAIGSVGTV
jgi:ribulose-phosphate 3-epimerase